MMLRGNARQDIFADDEERHGFYALLAEGVERFGYRLHGFCLMSNHVHLAAQVGALALSRIMQHLGFRYTQWFNRRHARVGHLFQGRYKAVLVDAEQREPGVTAGASGQVSQCTSEGETSLFLPARVVARRNKFA